MKTDKFFNTVLVIIAAFPLLGMKMAIIGIILMCLSSIIITFRDKDFKTIFKNWKTLLFLSSYYLIAVLSFVFVTEDTQRGLTDLETKAAFIVFPFFLFITRNKIKKETIDSILISFASSNIIVAIYIWIKIFSIGLFNILKEDNYYNPVFRKLFSDTTGIHLPYLGLLFGFSCLILAHFLIKKVHKIRTKLILILGIIILITSMSIFTARMAIFATFISMIYYLSSLLNKKALIIITVCALLIVTSLSFLSPVNRRIKELTKTELTIPDMSQNSEKVNFRYGIYYCVKNVLKENWLFGLGLGSVQKELNQCYDSFTYRNYDDFLVKKYNSHNQYLNAWMTYGVFGLFLLLFYLGYSFYGTNTLHKSFLILIGIAFLTENLLEREVGVVLLAYFNTLFVLLKKGK